MKLIVVTGGVMSGLGKGITAASMGRLLTSSGYSVTMMKLDPYLQIDAWTMSPFEHGETFVTKDGFETDLDLGHYERFIDEELTRNSSVTTGQIYFSVIQDERAGKFLGKTVQVIPHITNEVKERIRKVSEGKDVTIIEVGGTVWDIEGPHFLEALRQLRGELGKKSMLFVHVVPLLHISPSGELKTKALQHSVTKLRELGIHANVLVCRTDVALSEDIRRKIALFSDLEESHIIENRDQKSIYSVPLMFAEQGLTDLITQRFFDAPANCDLSTRTGMVDGLTHPIRTINIGLAGKYTALDDSYISVVEALKHAGAAHKTKIQIHHLNTETCEGEDREEVITRFVAEHQISWFLVPGWFGNRGVDGMITVADYARRHKIPYLGLCLGMQIAAIAFARNVCRLFHAHSTEFDPNTPDPVIDYLAGQKEINQKWGTMRLGNYESILKPGSIVAKLYGATTILERHRHRYEIHPAYHEKLEAHGLCISGTSPDGRLAEFLELPEHPFYVATQAHPEFRSRLQFPHPLFLGFVEASI